MKILLGYDRTTVSKNAIDLALVHARAFHAKVYIVIYVDRKIDNQENIIDGIKLELNHWQELYSREQIECVTHLKPLSQSAGEDLVEFSKMEQIDEIIMGIKKRSKVGKLIFGSNAQFVILSAPCPVITVK